MTIAKAQRVLLERFSAGTTVLLAVLLDLPMVPEWADSQDAEGRTVVLVGRHALGVKPDSDAVLGAVLDALASGTVPVGVHCVAFQPKASAAIATIVAGDVSEVLTWGSRASGKTQLAAGALAILGELHAREEFDGPVRVLWLHGSLVDASAKTGRSLEEPMWSGTWRLQNDRHAAVFSLGGTPLVIADFVGTQDVQAQERLRAGAHVIVAEEAVGTLDEAGGIAERSFAVALTSTLRLEGRRRIGIVNCNPGNREHWVYLRFLDPGHDPRRVAFHVPSRDRLNEAQIAAQAAPFRDAPDLKARLVDETWTDLKLGPEVAIGYDPAIHVASSPLWLIPNGDLWIGWDSGAGAHVHAAVIAQRNGPRIHVFASLVGVSTGLRQFIEDRVQPWLMKRAPWMSRHDNARAWLSHICDPSMMVSEGGDIDQVPEQRVRKTLGGRVHEAPSKWAGRIGPLLAVLAPTAEVKLLIDPGPDCDVIRRAFAGMWHYDLTRGGTVERDAPAKNERVFADTGDAACYVIGALTPSKPRRSTGPRPKAKTSFSIGDHSGFHASRRP